jgi:hypothetical protein
VFFLVAAVFVWAQQAEDMRKRVLRAEQSTGRGRKKWVRSRIPQKAAYLPGRPAVHPRQRGDAGHPGPQGIGLADRTVRFFNSIDPLPGAVPGGDHIGTPVYLDSNGQAALGEDGHDWDRLKGVAKAICEFNLNPLQDHYPARYVQRIADPANAAVLDEVARRLS